jgi:hypothetical protein
MATGESSAAVHGAAEAVATTGHDAAHAVARLTEEAATTQERLITAVEAADRESATRFAAASGRSEFPVASGVAGPARGRKLRMPNPRHTVRGARDGQVRPRNTVILTGYEQAVREDVEGIAAGRAELDHAGSVYSINGRSYGVEPQGTVFPISGPGLVQLDRNEYAALSEIAKAGGDIERVEAFRRNPRFTRNPDAVARAKAIYEGTYQQ